MIYDWYKLFNLTEFEATGLVSRTIEVIFEGVGAKTALVTKGNLVSVTIDDVMLSLDLNEKNPFEFEDYALYIDESDDVWVGTASES